MNFLWLLALPFVLIVFGVTWFFYSVAYYINGFLDALFFEWGYIKSGFKK